MISINYNFIPNLIILKYRLEFIFVIVLALTRISSVTLSFKALADFAYAFGQVGGSAAMGMFFSLIGSRATLFYYSIATTIILVLFMGYIFCGKHLDDYEQVCRSESEDNE